jgi:hypothetical protein
VLNPFLDKVFPNVMTAIYGQAKGGDGYTQEPSVKVRMEEISLDDCADELSIFLWFPWLHDIN